MKPAQVRRAVAAAMSTASALGLKVDDALVLHNSNKLAVRLLPCDVFGRIAEVRGENLRWAEFEVELALRLAATQSPVAALEPRVEPRGYVRDGFIITLWTYYEPVSRRTVKPAEYAETLKRLHAGMREVDIPSPHFMDRIAEAQALIGTPTRTPKLRDADRELLTTVLRSLRQSIGDRGAAEQLLHGEPHPGNLIRTKKGLLFVDLETCCRGPVEFDIAHAPAQVGEHYPHTDQELVRQCRTLTLAMVTAWRWDREDQLPGGIRLGTEWLGQLRAEFDVPRA